MDIKLKVTERRQLHQALVKSFSSSEELLLMVKNYVNPEWVEDLPGESKSRKLIADAIMEHAKARSSVRLLVEGATAANPENLQLMRVAERLCLEPPTEELESKIRERGKVTHVEEYFTTLRDHHHAVCRIAIDTAKQTCFGTGFLIGQSLVMTNHHVVQPLVAGKAEAGGARAQFGFKRLSDGTESQGKSYGFADGDGRWLAASGAADGLDYAVVRLDGTPGDDAPGENPLVDPRGWIDLGSDAAPPPPAGDPLVIIEHPEGDPMGIAHGKRTDRREGETSFGHDVTTHPGSSGSPCFAADDLKLVGLHYRAGNAAVRMPAIVDHLQPQKVV